MSEEDAPGRIDLAEFVTSVGAISEPRREDLDEKLAPAKRIGYAVRYVTAFPDRRTFARFAGKIAYGTLVWIASEPEHLIHFNGET